MNRDVTKAELRIRFAVRADLEQILRILEEAAVLQEHKGGAYMAWYPDEYGLRTITTAINARIGVVASRGSEIAGFMFLQDEDQDFWPDDRPGDALYIHRLAVNRRLASKGVSRAMLDWAVEQAHFRSIPAVKLDCIADPKVMALYEGAGFKRYGTELYQPPGELYWNWRYVRKVSGD